MPLSSSLAGPTRRLAVCACTVAREKRLADLVFARAYAGPDEGIGAEIALDVSGDDFSCDVLAEDKPLVCARHGGRVGRCEEERGEEARRARRVSSEDKGQAKGSAETEAWQRQQQQQAEAGECS